MGSWNHVCMATRLPVVQPDKVVAFFLTKESDDFSHHCYADGYWAPIPIPIYGSYNDYGAVHEFTGQFDDLFLDHVKKRLVPRIDEYHQTDLDISTMTLPDLFEGDHEGNLAYKHPWDQKMPLRAIRHVVIKLSFWDKVLAEHRIETYVGGYSRHNRVEVSFADLTTNLSEQIAKLRAHVTRMPAIFITMGDNIFSTMKDPPPITDWLGRRPTNYGGHKFCIAELMKSMEEDVFEAWVIEQLKVNWFINYMAGAHLQWGPITNSSQEFDFAPYQLMADYIGESIEEHRTRYDDEGYDPDEDDEPADSILDQDDEDEAKG